MYDLTLFEWIIAILGAGLLGLAKGAFPGLGILSIGLFAMVFDSAESTGIALMILFIANIVAIVLYRKLAHWPSILKLMPFAIVGIVLGYCFIQIVHAAYIRPMIGIILLTMTAVHFYRKYRYPQDEFEEETTVLSSPFFIISIGILGGFSTMVANAAGPVTIIYLMTLRLEKVKLIATMVWFYFFINIIKIPFQVSLGNINTSNIQLSLILGAIAIAAVFVSPYILKKLPQDLFNKITWALVVAASLKLLF